MLCFCCSVSADKFGSIKVFCRGLAFGRKDTSNFVASFKPSTNLFSAIFPVLAAPVATPPMGSTSSGLALGRTTRGAIRPP